MNYKYNNLSHGYTGKIYKNSTRNSQYYSLFLDLLSKLPDSINHVIAFPQRIPRKDFFKELYELESKEFRKNFDSMINIFINNHINSLENLICDNSENNAREYINWSNILLRYGKFESIIKYFPINYCGPNHLEIKLIKETAKIELLLSNNISIRIDDLLELVDQFYNNITISNIEKIKILNQLIVYSYRHKIDHASKKIFNLSKYLLSYVEILEKKTFINIYQCSIAYRGIAMVLGFSNETRASFLNESLNLARYLQPKCELERMVSLDNLFTCTQSLAKWSLENNQLKLAEENLLQLIKIDPYDSTGFSELGFFYIKNEMYDKAAHYFKVALELGPPGTGMNIYYYALCLEKLGNKNKALNFLYLATEIDKLAISPWLEILNYYLNDESYEKARKIAVNIYNDENLMEQLEHDEILFIKNIIN